MGKDMCFFPMRQDFSVTGKAFTASAYAGRRGTKSRNMGGRFYKNFRRNLDGAKEKEGLF